VTKEMNMKLAFLMIAAQITTITASFHVCESGNPKFIGHYTEDSVSDGSPRYSNEEGMSIFRHQGKFEM
jgi:hypothetical protein